MKTLLDFLDDAERELEALRFDVHNLADETARDIRLNLPEIEKRLGALVDEVNDQAHRIRITETTKNETPKGR